MRPEKIPTQDKADQAEQQESRATATAEHDRDSSDLSDPPTDLDTPSPLANKNPKTPKKKQPRRKPTAPSPSSSSPPPPQPTIPPGYKINSLTGNLMVDPKSRDFVANFRLTHHPHTDFSSGQYIDPHAYAVSTRHVPPNVPWSQRPEVASGRGRYQGPPDDGEERRDSVYVKRVGKAGEYRFAEDESWKAATGEGEQEKVVEDAAENEEGDTTLTDPEMVDSSSATFDGGKDEVR